jgi:hypothetical protein
MANNPKSPRTEEERGVGGGRGVRVMVGGRLLDRAGCGFVRQKRLWADDQLGRLLLGSCMVADVVAAAAQPGVSKSLNAVETWSWWLCNRQHTPRVRNEHAERSYI